MPHYAIQPPFRSWSDALDELYRRQENGWLTHAAYESLGGVEGALARRAEEIFTALPATAQHAFDDLARRLVMLETGADSAPTRLWASIDEDRVTDPLRLLLDRLVAERLIITDLAQDGRPVVSIAHEALLVAWPRLADWIASNREFLRAKGRLAHAAREWEAQQRAADYLLIEGKPLSEARELLQKFPEALDGSEQELVRQSLKRAGAAARRRLRIVSGVAGVLALLLLVAVILWVRSDENARAATRARAGADDLVNHMLTDLHEQLKASGSVGVLASSLKKVRSYYEKHGAEMPPARKIQLLTAQGAILKSLGKGSEASAAFATASQTAEEALAKTPHNAELLGLQARALSRRSDLLASTDLREGQKAAERSIAILQPLAAADQEYRADLAEALMNRADLERRLALMEPALQSYEESRSLF